MTPKVLSTCIVALAAWVLAVPARADDLIKEALASFPPQTVRLEYSNPAKLRTLPEYTNLRARYMGPSLQNLVGYLAKLGIQEGDIDQVVLGWQPGADRMVLEGLASGRFNPKVVAQRAAEQGVNTVRTTGPPAYCFGDAGETVCFVVLSRTLGAFGPNPAIDAMLDTRRGGSPGLSSDQRFTALVTTQDQKDSPIWGVAVPPAVVDWFKGWMPGQKNVQLDWSSAFKSVESVAYNVNPADKVRLYVRMNCTTSEAAGSLRQVLDGLRIFQQIAWKNLNPTLPNPFDNLAIDAEGRSVLLTLTTGYEALQGALGK